MGRIRLQKALLLALIGLTTVFPFTFVRFNEPSAALQTYKALAKAGALCGTMLLVWQFFLGFRQVAGKFTRDLLWALGLHKRVGRYALFLIVLHPAFITLYYLEKKGFNPLSLQGGWPFWGFALLGHIALALLILIVVTSVFLRGRMQVRTWYLLHLTAYLALPFVMVHSTAIGMTVTGTALGTFWRALGSVLAAFYLFRILCWLGLLSKRHVVSEVESVGPNVVKITAEPLGRRVAPELGQFVYWRRGMWGPTRPFTVSHYDPEDGKIRITVKALGKATTEFQSTQPGETVYIDGPYGVFSRAALKGNRPIVMIAGGIGITPFVRLFEELAYEPDRELHLFYGNKRTNEIVYEEELCNVETISVTHVISHDPHYPGETGLITVELLRKRLERDLADYEFLICGPPVMTVKLETALSDEGVPRAQIHHELFSY